MRSPLTRFRSASGQAAAAAERCALAASTVAASAAEISDPTADGTEAVATTVREAPAAPFGDEEDVRRAAAYDPVAAGAEVAVEGGNVTDGEGIPGSTTNTVSGTAVPGAADRPPSSTASRRHAAESSASTWCGREV